MSVTKSKELNFDVYFIRLSSFMGQKITIMLYILTLRLKSFSCWEILQFHVSITSKKYTMNKELLRKIIWVVSNIIITVNRTLSACLIFRLSQHLVCNFVSCLWVQYNNYNFVAFPYLLIFTYIVFNEFSREQKIHEHNPLLHGNKKNLYLHHMVKRIFEDFSLYA